MSVLRIFAVLALVPSMVTAASPVTPVICAPKDEMRQKLTQQFAARQIAMGVRDPESVMEVWSSDSTGDWTMVLTYTDGNSCIVAMGHDWFNLTPPSHQDPA